jgi:hypothetical protein
MTTGNKYSHVKKAEAAPLAESLIESLRNLGYTPETAIADIIDNAVFAKAKNVWIDFLWDGLESRISFRDDGNGMTDDELMQAMRPGSQNPMAKRDAGDLGRFGLGLKTASFSQCRVFTVISKIKSKAESAYWRWDMNYVNELDGGWNIYQIADEADITRIESMSKGTLVVWEHLDRITGTPGKKINEDDFFSIAEKAKRHIEMVFHRYLENGKLNIIFNGRPAIAWDPFLRGQTATQPFPDELMADGAIVVRAYILPHRSKLDEEIWMENESRGGWDALQGFYIYRNERLLLAADWLGITRKKPQYKLARIMINLPNNLDHDWQIDIKKSRAKPPLSLRQDLKAIARAAMVQAEQVYRHRGKQVQRSLPKSFSFVWIEMVKDNRYFFRINQEHPVVAALLEKFPGNQKELKRLLRVLEETVPGPAIIAKENEYPDSMIRPYEKTPSEELTSLIREIYKGWKKQGSTTDAAKKRLIMTEPFSDYPQLIETLTDD